MVSTVWRNFGRFVPLSPARCKQMRLYQDGAIGAIAATGPPLCEAHDYGIDAPCTLSQP